MLSFSLFKFIIINWAIGPVEHITKSDKKTDRALEQFACKYLEVFKGILTSETPREWPFKMVSVKKATCGART
jgi:hypothetical protein